MADDTLRKVADRTVRHVPPAQATVVGFAGSPPPPPPDPARPPPPAATPWGNGVSLSSVTAPPAPARPPGGGARYEDFIVTSDTSNLVQIRP